MQNFNNPYAYQQAPMYNPMGYTMQPQKKVTCNNPLTKAQMELLKQKGDKLQLGLTDVEIAKAICTHKDPNTNNIMLMNDPTNPTRVTCAICGETFELVEGDTNTVEAACNLMKNIFQTLKTYWLDVPDEVARNLYTILPLIDKIPKVYNIASKSFSQVERANNMTEAGQPYGFNMLMAMGMPQNPMGMGMYQQPVVMPQQQPIPNMAFPNPVGQQTYPTMGYVPQPGYAPNPVAMPQYGAPAYQQDPNANPFGYNGVAAPTQQQAPAAPQATVENTAPAQAQQPTVVNDKVFSV
jgi:hypothetical protein